MIDIVEKAKDLVTDKVTDAVKSTDVSETADATKTEETTESAITIKEEIADLYLDMLDKDKGGLYSLAPLGIRLNPARIFAKEKLLSLEAKEKKLGFFDRIEKNIKKTFLGKLSGSSDALKYSAEDQTKLDSMKTLIASDDVTKLEALKQQIEDGEDPTVTTDKTPTADTKTDATTKIAAGAALGATTEKLITSLEYIYPFTAKEIETQGFSAKHSGIDIGAAEGTQIYSVCSGTVEDVGGNYKPYSGYGNHIVIKTEDGKYILYAHLQEIPTLLKESKITVGDPIGKVGETGVATGPHLHFEVRTGGTKGSDAVAENPLTAFPDLLEADRIVTPVAKEATT